MPAGAYRLPKDGKKALLESVEGLSYFVVEKTSLERLIASVDCLRKNGWTVSGHFCINPTIRRYCQPMYNNTNLTVIDIDHG